MLFLRAGIGKVVDIDHRGRFNSNGGRLCRRGRVRVDFVQGVDKSQKPLPSPAD